MLHAPTPKDAPSAQAYLKSIEEEIGTLELDEKARLNIVTEETKHWFDAVPTTFTAEQRAHTTILHAGLTMAHDLFIQSAFRGLGYKVEAMDVPDTKSLQLGREFGNRGQCNPTYFTVGNLVKQLKQMEVSGLHKKDIIKNYLFATAGSCGPCRFGTYVTEYRKALRDAGFEGFRVILFQQSGGIKQATGLEAGLKIDANFFKAISKAIILGDVLNALMYRIRPYEITVGQTDKVLDDAKKRIAIAFETNAGMLSALWKTRKELAAIKVDRSQIKPKVAIIGEFWAMTTEGDGNYKMHRFLEKEGAEVDIQLVTNWALYLLWGATYDTRQRLTLKGTDSRLTDENQKGSKFGLEGVNVQKKLWMLRGAQWFLRGQFTLYAKLLGLADYHLPDMDHIADISHKFYDNNLRGGEGHMEVGKLIHNVVDQKVNMTLSIKPFGCMPSSAVSDGVQSLITELYPAAIFLPIETSGDGAVNVYSRVQMQLFKARQAAEKEFVALLEKMGDSKGQYKTALNQAPSFSRSTYRSPHYGGCTAVDQLQDFRHKQSGLLQRLRRITHNMLSSTRAHKAQTLAAVELAAKHFFEKKRENSVKSAVKFVEL